MQVNNSLDMKGAALTEKSGAEHSSLAHQPMKRSSPIVLALNLVQMRNPPLVSDHPQIVLQWSPPSKCFFDGLPLLCLSG